MCGTAQGPSARLLLSQSVTWDIALLESTVNVVRFALSVLYLSVDNQVLLLWAVQSDYFTFLH